MSSLFGPQSNFVSYFIQLFNWREMEVSISRLWRVLAFGSPPKPPSYPWSRRTQAHEPSRAYKIKEKPLHLGIPMCCSVFLYDGVTIWEKLIARQHYIKKLTSWHGVAGSLEWTNRWERETRRPNAFLSSLKGLACNLVMQVKAPRVSMLYPRTRKFEQVEATRCLSCLRNQEAKAIRQCEQCVIRFRSDGNQTKTSKWRFAPQLAKTASYRVIRKQTRNSKHSTWRSPPFGNTTILWTTFQVWAR